MDFELKAIHIIGPVLAIAAMFLVLQTNDPDMLALWNAAEPLDDLAVHLMHAVGGTFLVLAVNNVCAVLYGSSVHRATALALHGVFASVDTWSYIALKRDVPGSLYAMLAAVVVGLLVHSQEPGIFTKDKKQTAASKKN